MNFGLNQWFLDLVLFFKNSLFGYISVSCSSCREKRGFLLYPTSAELVPQPRKQQPHFSDVKSFFSALFVVFFGNHYSRLTVRGKNYIFHPLRSWSLHKFLEFLCMRLVHFPPNSSIPNLGNEILPHPLCFWILTLVSHTGSVGILTLSYSIISFLCFNFETVSTKLPVLALNSVAKTGLELMTLVSQFPKLLGLVRQRFKVRLLVYLIFAPQGKTGSLTFTKTIGCYGICVLVFHPLVCVLACFMST